MSRRWRVRQAGSVGPGETQEARSTGQVTVLEPDYLAFSGGAAYHVAMYIGNGQVVNADSPSTGVRVDAIDFMPVSAVVHIG